MIDAWFSSSEQTSVPGPPNVVSTPRLAANPVGKRTAASACFHAASSRSSSECTGRDPTIRRAAPAPVPQRSIAACAAATTRRVLGEPEVVVRRERDDRPPVGCELAFRAGGVEVDAARATDRRPGSPGLARRPRRPNPTGRPAHDASPVVTSSSASARVCTIRWSSSDVTVERRHEDDDVAERAEEHPALDRGGADPAAPAQPVRRRRELDAAHEPAQPDVRDLGQRDDPVVEQIAQLVRAGAHVGEHVARVDAARGGAARPRPRARSRCRSARGTASAPRGPDRGTPRTRGPTRRSPTSGGTRRSGPCRGRAGRVGCAACSDANSVPVRPNPVATSSQISSTSCSRHAAASAARSSAAASCIPAAPCTSGSTITAASSGACSATIRHAVAKQSGSANSGRPQDREAERIEEVRAEAAVAERERTDRVAVVRAAEGEERRAARRLPGSPSTGTRSSAPARPRTRRRTRRGSGGRRPAPRGRAPRTARRRPGCRCRASWCAHRARAGAVNARRRARGRAWPSVVTQSDEIASR